MVCPLVFWILCGGPSISPQFEISGLRTPIHTSGNYLNTSRNTEHELKRASNKNGWASLKLTRTDRIPIYPLYYSMYNLSIIHEFWRESTGFFAIRRRCRTRGGSNSRSVRQYINSPDQSFNLFDRQQSRYHARAKRTTNPNTSLLTYNNTQSQFPSRWWNRRGLHRRVRGFGWV